MPAGLGPLGVLRGERPEFGMGDAGSRLHQRPDEAVPDRVRHVEQRKPLLARRTLLHAPVHDDRDVQEPRLRVALELLQRGGDARSPEQEPLGVGRPFGHRRPADRRLRRQGPHPVDPPLLARPFGGRNRPQLPRRPSPLRGCGAPGAAGAGGLVRAGSGRRRRGRRARVGVGVVARLARLVARVCHGRVFRDAGLRLAGRLPGRLRGRRVRFCHGLRFRAGIDVLRARRRRERPRHVGRERGGDHDRACVRLGRAVRRVDHFRHGRFGRHGRAVGRGRLHSVGRDVRPARRRVGRLDDLDERRRDGRRGGGNRRLRARVSRARHGLHGFDPRLVRRRRRRCPLRPTRRTGCS